MLQENNKKCILFCTKFAISNPIKPLNFKCDYYNLNCLTNKSITFILPYEIYLWAIKGYFL